MGCMNSKPAGDGASHPVPKPPAANMSTVVQDLDGIDDENNAEVLRELRLLDSDLVASLQRGDIRLLRATWLCAQPDGFRLPNRQELEALLDVDIARGLREVQLVELIQARLHLPVRRLRKIICQFVNICASNVLGVCWPRGAK